MPAERPDPTAADADRRRSEAVSLAAELIRVDSTNGNETAVAEVLADYLADNGVEAELVARDPARANLLARIPGTGGGPSLALVGHSDVVPADPRDWTHPPFAGVIDDDGYLWGRGAVDMKNEVAARAATLASLARSGWRGTGDLLLVIVADEEDGAAEVGMNWLVRERPDIATTYALNEGGGIAFRLTDGRHLTEISVGEKGTCPIRVDAIGEAGHASTPTLGDNAVPLLGQLLARLGRGEAEPQDHPQVRIMLETLLGAGAVERLGLTEAIRQGGLLHPDLATSLPAVAGTTMSPTLLHGAPARNVMPARAGVELDCRILPGTTEQDVLEAVRRRLGDDIPYELLQPEPANHGNASSADEPAVGRRTPVRRRAARHDAVPDPVLGLHRLGLPAPRVRDGGVRLQPVRDDARARDRRRLPQRRRAGARRRHRPEHRLPRLRRDAAPRLRLPVRHQDHESWTLE